MTTNRRELADRLIGYAVHDDACTVNRFPGQDVCSCGLSSLLQEARHREPVAPDPLLEEAVGLLRRWQASLPSEALEDITDAFIARAARLNAERKGGEDG